MKWKKEEVGGTVRWWGCNSLEASGQILSAVTKMLTIAVRV